MNEYSRKMVKVPTVNLLREQDMGKLPVLDVRNLGIDFGGLTAVDGFSITVGPTEISGLIGPNGDHYFQPAHRCVPAYPRLRADQRHRHQGYAHPQGEQAGHRPYLPEYPPVLRYVRTGQCQGGYAQRNQVLLPLQPAASAFLLQRQPPTRRPWSCWTLWVLQMWPM